MSVFRKLKPAGTVIISLQLFSIRHSEGESGVWRGRCACFVAFYRREMLCAGARKFITSSRLASLSSTIQPA